MKVEAVLPFSVIVSQFIKIHRVHLHYHRHRIQVFNWDLHGLFTFHLCLFKFFEFFAFGLFLLLADFMFMVVSNLFLTSPHVHQAVFTRRSVSAHACANSQQQHLSSRMFMCIWLPWQTLWRSVIDRSLIVLNPGQKSVSAEIFMRYIYTVRSFVFVFIYTLTMALIDCQ